MKHRHNFRNFNGEDIECFNRKLSQATVSTSLRSNVRLLVLSSFIFQTDSLNSRYKMLGLFSERNQLMRTDISSIKIPTKKLPLNRHLKVIQTPAHLTKVLDLFVIYTYLGKKLFFKTLG